MGSYGITALNGLPGAMDRQERRTDRQDQREWNEEARGHQREAWDRNDQEYAAGAENRELSRGNNKMKLLVDQGNLEREKLFQDLRPAFQTLGGEGGDKTAYGEAMAKILSGVNHKDIRFLTSSDESYQFGSTDGKTYGFKDFNHARDQIGLTFKDPVEFVKRRAEAMAEEGLWVKDGKVVQMKRGAAEREGLTPYAVEEGNAKLSALSRKNQGSYKIVETDKGPVAYNDQDPNKRVAMGGPKPDPKARKAGIEADMKQTDKYRKDLSLILMPFAKQGTDFSQMFNSNGEMQAPAKNALASAQAFVDKHEGKEASLSPSEQLKFTKAKKAIKLYNAMSDTVYNQYDQGNALSGPKPEIDPNQPPVEGARQAPDGKWYIADPKRPGKYILVNTEVGE